MNGVRRFLAAAGTSTSPSPPSASRELANPPLSNATQPLNGPSWLSPSPTPPFIIKELSRRLQPTPPPDDSPPPVPPVKGLTSRKLTMQNQPLSDKRSSDASSVSGATTRRDELLLSLLASQAVVDSRDFEIMDSEQYEELTKEHQLLSTRLQAISKKLTTETKIRDAAVSLSKINASAKKVNEQTEEQVASATKRVGAVQQELFRLSERAHEVHKRLLEHRAGVLSYSLRNVEQAAMRGPPNGVGEHPGYDSSNRSTMMSPTLTRITGFSTSTGTETRFDGPHLFAGHADAVVPRRQLFGDAATAQIIFLEEKLKAATESLTVAGKKQAELTRELSMLKLEKIEVETMMGMDLQTAEETIKALRDETSQLEDLDIAMKQLQEEKRAWREEKTRLDDQAAKLQQMKSRREDLEVEKELEESRRLLQEKEEEIRRTKEQWQTERDVWARRKTELEDEKMEDLARLQQEMDRAREEDELALELAHRELDAGLEALQLLVKQHGIVLFSRDRSLEGLLSSVSTHLETVHRKLESHSRTESEWNAVRRKLEEDVRAGLDKRESLGRELEDVRRERDEARQDARAVAERSIASETSSPQSHVPPSNDNMHVLMPLWSILPSPEARAAKFSNQSRYRTTSPTHSPGPIKMVSSLSELDVRSLKSLYDSTRQPMSPAVSGGEFSVEAFAARVRALVQDDRALIERLLRFAQAHDLLKKNAERAQKLALEGNNALETYQKQVRTLEERNMMLASKQAVLIEETQQLQNSLERAENEKRELEALATDQAETCAQLAEANHTLSARTLTLAEEAASVPEKVRKQLEAQLSETRAELQQAQDEVDAMRTSEQSQRIALLDELNTTQKENELLRAQLRARK